MALTIDDFAEFFAALNGGRAPFRWQERLARHLAKTGQWPDLVSAPTGSGKSSVVDVHVFVNALSALGAGARVPRRLMVCVDRRALVDKHAERAARIARSLAESDKPILVTVRDALSGLSPLGTVLQLGVLRGGLAPDRGWVDDPSACAVIAATPGMGGSRLLMLGWGSTPQARPREAGLLAFDTAAILDEAHLSRQFLHTARRVADLVKNREKLPGVPGLQVVQTTATPDPGFSGVSIGVEKGDVIGEAAEEVLASRLLADKPVVYHALDGELTTDKRVKALAREVRGLLDAGPGQRRAPIGCIVNNVDVATRTVAELRKDKTLKDLRIECWVGRMRPMDVNGLLSAHPGLTKADADPKLDILVATQSVEVGVDIDLGALVTELAPATALVQRAGRVNRLGRWDDAKIVVVGPGDMSDVPDGKGLPPYVKSDLVTAREWLDGLCADGHGMSPWLLADTALPSQTPRRPALFRPEPSDVRRWAATSLPGFCAEDAELWLDDDLDPDLDMGLVVRGPLPEDNSSAVALLSATPPTADETFPVAIGTARSLLGSILESEGTEDKGRHCRVFVARSGSGETGVQAVTDPAELGRFLRPGTVVVVDAGWPVTEGRVVVGQLAEKREELDLAWGEAVRVLTRAGENTEDVRILDDLSGLDPHQASVWWAEHGNPGEDLVLPIACGDDDALDWLVAIDTSAVSERDRQIWTVARHPVLLDRHGEDVAERGHRLAVSVGLDDHLAGVVRKAGLMHDLGKADRRFQAALGAGPGEPAIAKGRQASRQEARRAWHRSGLPAGWRHELRSVLAAWEDPSLKTDRDLIARLVGTSHGHARPLGAHPVAGLTTGDDPATMRDLEHELFCNGGWDAIVESTQRIWGVWACCYLEALVRAADCQISQEDK